MRHRFFKSVRAHLLILVLISIFPALGIILYSGYDRQRDAMRDAELSMLAVMNSIATRHERTVEGTRQMLTTLSKLPDVRALNAEACNGLLKDLREQNPVYANIYIADMKGDAIAGAIRFNPFNVRDRLYFKEAVKTKNLSAGEYGVGLASGAPIVQFAYPILDRRGRLRGVAAASVDLAHYGKTLSGESLPEGASFCFTDHQGTGLLKYPLSGDYIGEPDQSMIMSAIMGGPDEGTFSCEQDGVMALFAYKRFRLYQGQPPYLYLHVSIPQKQALAHARRILLIDLTLLAVVFFIALASALVIGKVVIVRRLESLVEASRRLGTGDLESRTGLPHGEDELGRLALAFDTMAEALEQKEKGRKQAADALASQLHFLQNLIDTIPNAIFHKDTDGFYQGCNKAFEEYTGLSRDRIVGRTVFEVHPPDVAGAFHLKDNELFSHPGIQSYEAELKMDSGRKRDIIVTKATYYDGTDRVAGLIGVMVDITERKETEARLAYETSRFSSLSENAPFGMMVFNGEGEVTYLNPRFREMFGYDQSDIQDGGSWLVLAFPDPAYRKYVLSVWFDDIQRARQGAIREKHFTVRCKDGTEKIASFMMVFLESGEEIISCEDITIRFRAEETLKESEETLRALINATTESLLMIDPEGTILVANEVVARRLGGTVESVVGTCQYDYFDPEVAAARKAQYDRVVETGESGHFVDSRMGRVFETYCDPVFDSDGKVSRLVIFAHDITENRRAEEERVRLESQLRQSQKMEAIGTLAGGVAHDFNNILTAITGYGSLLQMKMERHDPKTVYVDQILASSQKAAILTQSLLAFGRKQVMELKPHKINELVRETEKLLKRLLTEDIEFQVVLHEPGVTVRADVTQIDQVLMNLAANARDAMPMGGKFTIETGVATLDTEAAEVRGLDHAGTYAVIHAIDTGTGMDRETREKIFEPFFTTKEVGRGTGLGLSIVYGIVTQHNGHIDVTSEPGLGTRFTIYLPAAEGEVEEARREESPAAGGNETILVAEDNEGVRMLAREILTGAGYRVIEAADGDDAVRRFREHRDEIALLLLDVVMPRRNGKEAYEEICSVRSHVKVLFTSGYTGDVILTKGLDDEALNFISKPLSPNELLRKVRDVLDR